MCQYWNVSETRSPYMFSVQNSTQSWIMKWNIMREKHFCQSPSLKIRFSPKGLYEKSSNLMSEKKLGFVSGVNALFVIFSLFITKWRKMDSRMRQKVPQWRPKNFIRLSSQCSYWNINLRFYLLKDEEKLSEYRSDWGALCLILAQRGPPSWSISP